MARKLRELTAFMAVLLLSLVFTACSHSQSSSTYDRVKQTNTITWGMRADTRLFSMMDVDSGKATGFEVDLARAITKRILGPKGKMKIEYISEKSRTMDLKIGNVDAVMATMTNTPDRRKIINFSDTYFMAGETLIVPKKSKLNSIKDFNNSKYSIAAVKGSTADSDVHKYAPKARVIFYDDYGSCYNALKAGKANAMVSDNAVLAGLISDDKDKFKMLPDTFTVEPYGIGIKKGEDKFTAEVNQALKVLRKNGTYARLMKKWFNGVPGFNIKSSSRLKASE
ncbi:transporter substrate-binding domain-containing protein [Lactobacillus delbrueckii]|uniref:transporter substrate-binding domain-containing protein n=1 Tax=Lactobacillus delbrueckii TaxID=1584 RepID=UPI001F366E9D|nr:transporter substrate-binding domain-containing protein [Lactobacillus delbrueckii]MDF4030011.1 transporter substrate-binding domain-containing protein [Lactobacillus delbrueckii]GHN35243.1 glutamine ABC transporter substrate-binding protein [Lactobacillus delbrueckii]